MPLPSWIWVVVFVLMIGYEAWALYAGYEYTLTRGLRFFWEQSACWGSIIAAFLVWFWVHLFLEPLWKERNKKK